MLNGPLGVSFFLIGVSTVISWFLFPWAIVPLILGVLLNAFYEKAKGIPFLGNVVFGVMIALCSVYGYIATIQSMDNLFTIPKISVFFLVALINGLMTYYTYFKDYTGDRIAGKITAIVLYGIEKSKKHAIVASVLFPITLWVLISTKAITLPTNGVFIFLFYSYVCA